MIVIVDTLMIKFKILTLSVRLSSLWTDATEIKLNTDGYLKQYVFVKNA